ncbi:unnamed protein product [Eruca vesicaria subsp. sativa]|uniref:Myb/SANT-like DNA-binding domain-containing protein n=1 Tax=Eruca vesicaria subsp. sativa TaxID=29727 RepID=A0ABC8LDL4_ERUVS|nr:unnamed protein product [Eruca vesicaria subsp. sativa]
MDDSEEDETGYPNKFHPLNLQTHPMYTRPPIPKRHAYYHHEEEDEIEEYHRGNEKRLKPVSGYEFSDTNVEQEAFVLLEVWGDRFLQLGRRNLRNEDWNEVAEKVSEELGSERSDTQCRRMVDNLKRKYKKERAKLDKSGLGSTRSKWSFFNKLDMLFLGFSAAKPEFGLACGVDSGEFVFMNTKVYLDKSNGFDEMMDSPGDSEEDDDGEEIEYESERRKKGDDAASFKLLADSVERFGKVYEKMEKSKKEQMKELEKMRGDFQRDLEFQKKQIVERAQTEIARLREEEHHHHHHHDGGESENEGMENDSDVNLSD